MLKKFECSAASRLHLAWGCIVRTAKDVFAFFHQSQVDGLSFASIQINFTLQQFLAVITDSYLQVCHVDETKSVINFRAIFRGQLAIHGSHPLPRPSSCLKGILTQRQSWGIHQGLELPQLGRVA
jgi:hypothetical protein